MLISFETYAHVKDDVVCEERGHVQVKVAVSVLRRLWTVPMRSSLS